jgi:hypothetical protein
MVSVVQLYTQQELPPHENAEYTTIPVNRRDVVVHNALFLRDPGLFASLQTLGRYVVGLGMRVTKKRVGKKKKGRDNPQQQPEEGQGDGSTPPPALGDDPDEPDSDEFEFTDKYQSLFDNQWLQWLRKVLYFLAVFGFALVDVRPPEPGEGDMPIPFVRDPLEYDMTELRWRNGRKMWRISYASRNQAIPWQVMPNQSAQFMFHGFYNQQPNTTKRADPRQEDILTTGFVIMRNELQSDGSLDSEVCRIILTSELSRHAISSAAKTWNRNSRPALITQQQPKSAQDVQNARDVAAHQDVEAAEANAVEQRNASNVIALAKQQELVRQMNSESSKYYHSAALGDKQLDPQTGQPVYPLSREADPAFTVVVPLAEGLELKTPPPATPPEDLTAIAGFEEADVAKAIGVPSALWGAERQPRAVNDMVLHVLHAAVGDWRHILTQVAKIMLEVVWGDINIEHAFTKNWDDALSVDDNLANNKLNVQFDAAVDPEVLASFRDNGMMSWKQHRDLSARYFGIDPKRLTEQQVRSIGKRLKINRTPLGRFGETVEGFFVASPPRAVLTFFPLFLRPRSRSRTRRSGPRKSWWKSSARCSACNSRFQWPRPLNNSI